jgi:hypothetical protein
MRISASLTAVAVLVVALLAACGASESEQLDLIATPTFQASLEPELNAILATTVLRTGAQRVSFLLIGSTGIVQSPEAAVTPVHLPVDGSSEQAGEAQMAFFHLWPYGTRGSYGAEISFDRPGLWRLDISVRDQDGFIKEAQLLMGVEEEIGVVDIGDDAPASVNRTLADVGDIAEITSDSTPSPFLYNTTIADAVADDLPLMLVFATPALCTSPTCGPQVDTVQEVSDRYRGRARFIHVEIYENPAEIQGDLDRARLSPIVHEWGLSTVRHWFNESWVFVVDTQGRVTAKFEGFATAEELEEALLKVLG